MIPEFLDRPERAGHRRDRPEQEHRRTRPPCSWSTSTWPTKHRRADPDPHAAPGGQVPGDADDPGHARGDRRIKPQPGLIDHVEEHTIRPALEQGYWGGMTLYPVTKCTPARAADMVEMYGPERLLVNRAGDWGPSKPTAVPDFIMAMRNRGHAEASIRRVVYENPLEFFSQSKNFHFVPRDGRSTSQHASGSRNGALFAGRRGDCTAACTAVIG